MHFFLVQQNVTMIMVVVVLQVRSAVLIWQRSSVEWLDHLHPKIGE